MPARPAERAVLLAVAATLAAALGAAFSACSGPRSATSTGAAEPTEATAENTPFLRAMAERSFIDGSVMQMQGRFGEALQRYDRAARMAPRLAAVRYAMARCYRGMGLRDSALLRVNEALALDSNDVDARLLAGELLSMSGRAGEAAAQYEAVIARLPDHLDARYGAARMLERTDPARAIEHYEYIRRNITSDYNTLLGLSDLYMRSQRYDSGIQALRELLSVAPGDRDIYGLLTNACLLAGRYAEATALIDEVAAHSDSDSSMLEYLNARGRTVLRDPELETDDALQTYARAVARRIAALSPRAMQPRLLAGMLHFRLGDADVADSLLAQALGHRDADAETWAEVGAMYADAAAGVRGVRVLSPGAYRFRGNARVQYLMGRLWMAAERFDSAEKSLRRSVALDDNNADAWSRLGSVLRRMNQPAASESAYERAVELDTENPTILNNFAYSLAEFDRTTDNALALVLHELELDPDNGADMDTKGWVLFRMKDYNGALEYIQRSVDAGGAGAEVYEHLGDVHSARGEAAAARSAYERAVELSPNEERLRSKLRAVQ